MEVDKVAFTGSVAPSGGTTGADMAALKARSIANLGGQPHVLPNPRGPKALGVQRVYQSIVNRSPSGASHAAMVEVTHLAEASILREAANGWLSGDLGEGGCEIVLGLLQRLIDVYRIWNHAKKTYYDSLGLESQKIEAHSREVLLVWVHFCIWYAYSEGVYSDIMEHEFHVPLNPAQLQFLHLNTELERDVLKKVVVFLEERSGAKKLFHLEQQHVTWEFAREFALSARHGEEIRTLWAQEKTDADTRVEKHWEKVVEQQREAARLQGELQTKRSDLAVKEAARAVVNAKTRQIAIEAHDIQNANTFYNQANSRRSQILNPQGYSTYFYMAPESKARMAELELQSMDKCRQDIANAEARRDTLTREKEGALRPYSGSEKILSAEIQALQNEIHRAQSRAPLPGVLGSHPHSGGPTTCCRDTSAGLDPAISRGREQGAGAAVLPYHGRKEHP